MCSFDVIGRREFVSQLLKLPHVLQGIVETYIGNDIVPRYRFVNYSNGPILGVEGNDIYWKQGHTIMQNRRPIMQCKSANKVIKIKGSIILIASYNRFEIYNVDTEQIIGTIDGTSVIVLDEKIYYVDPVHRVVMYDLQTSTTLGNSTYALRKYYDTIICYHGFYIQVLLEKQSANREDMEDLYAVTDYYNKRIYVHKTRICCNGFPSLSLADDVTRVIGFDGFIVIACSSQFILDVRRWKLIPIDDSFFMKNDTVFKINGLFVEVYC